MNKVLLVFLLFTTVTHGFWPFSTGTTTTVKPRVIMNSTFDDFSNGTSSRDSENPTSTAPLETTRGNTRTSTRSTSGIHTTTPFSTDNSAF